jgi:hypothetical protein
MMYRPWEFETTVYLKPQIKVITGHKSDKAVVVYIGNSLVQKLAAAQALSIPVPSFEEDDAAARGVSSNKKQRREEAGTCILYYLNMLAYN